MLLLLVMKEACVTSLLVILSIFCSSTWAYHVRRQQSECDWGIPCPGDSDRCVSEYWLCNGQDDCGDNSDENPEFCRANGAYQARACMNELEGCLWPLALMYGGQRPEQIRETLISTDLRETCGPVLAIKECVLRTLSSEPECEMNDTKHPRVVSIGKTISAFMAATDFVCQDHVQEFNEQKECLLSYAGRDFVIMEQIDRQCRQHLSTPSPTFCPSPESVGCVEGVVSAQCGPDVAGLIRTLGERMLNDTNCTTNHKRSDIMKMTKKEMASPLKMLQEALSSLF